MVFGGVRNQDFSVFKCVVDMLNVIGCKFDNGIDAWIQLVVLADNPTFKMYIR